MAHNSFGFAEADHYERFVEAINSSDRTLFERSVVSAAATTPPTVFGCTLNGQPVRWRGWESPRAGHVYELEGPDAGSVGMAPAPRVGASELAAEMAEVYALALLRDVPFTTMAAGGDARIDGGTACVSAQQAVDALNSMPFFADTDATTAAPRTIVSSTPGNTDGSGLNHHERNRRAARTDNNLTGAVTLQNVFRGSAPGAETGPYISQFLLTGTEGRAGAGGGAPSYPGKDAVADPADGYLVYGTQIIDQRCTVHKVAVDHMTTWQHWLDVQNGADIGGAAEFEDKRRFITTPRDLATYVHYDQLYQAYLNAAFLLLANGTPTSSGFPEPSPSGNRTPFATFGGPHILSLVTEVATRCLKAVRRQKFNYHRRGRPELLGGRLTMAKLAVDGELGAAHASFDELLAELPANLMAAVAKHNEDQNAASAGPAGKHTIGNLVCPAGNFPNNPNAAKLATSNYLLPMAFAEGSPMHPAYGAGHATVAGGCVTMLKAFFEMFDATGPGGERVLKVGSADYVIPNAAGTALRRMNDQQLTIQGELNKLAANISIGRNMAGVHYYSDYYDSLRMGERIAVGILLEQATTYGDEVEVSFGSFDGDLLTLSGEGGSCPTLSVLDRNGTPVPGSEWWLRHVAGEEVMLAT